MNNVNMKGINKFLADSDLDPSILKVTRSITGSWLFKEGGPQFSAKVSYPEGQDILIADISKSLGGWGQKPDPVQYLLFGFLSCFTASFAINATEANIRLSKLNTTIESSMDTGRALDLSDNNILSGMKIIIDVEGPTPEELIDLIEKSQGNCPGIECITRSIPLKFGVK